MKKIKNAKVLVIGGSGFIGGFVVSELLKYDIKKLSFMIILLEVNMIMWLKV